MQKGIKFELLAGIDTREVDLSTPLIRYLLKEGILEGIDVHMFCDEINKMLKNNLGETSIGVIVYDDLSYCILLPEQYLDYMTDYFANNEKPMKK